MLLTLHKKRLQIMVLKCTLVNGFDIRLMQSQSRQENVNKPQAKPKYIIDEDDDSDQLTESDKKELKELISIEPQTRRKADELPLSNKSHSDNSHYGRKDRHKDKDENLGIAESPELEKKIEPFDNPNNPNYADPRAPMINPRAPMINTDDRDWFTKVQQAIFTKDNKVERNVGIEQTKIEEPLNDLPMNTQKTREQAFQLYSSTLTEAERKAINKEDSTEIRVLHPSLLLKDIEYNEIVTKVDIGLKLATMQFEHIALKVGVNIEKSEALVTQWDEIKKRLADHLKTLETVNWKKALTYFAVGSAIVGFIYQCGLVGKLPNFAATIFSNIPLPNFNNVPKPKIEDASTLELISKIMEKPVTFSPLSTLTGMGGLISIVLIIKAFRIARTIIRK